MTIEEFSQQLQGVKGGAGQYTALCPAHDDKNNSLSIGTGDNGGILLTCHAGCSVESITTALGLTVKDLFRERAKKSNSPVVATYSYTDINGVLLAKKFRREDKSFFWQSPDGTYKKPNTPMLYNAPALLSNPIYIVEGEKDVETVKALHRNAVSAPDGAGGKSKWLSAMNEHFRDKTVYIIPDNDQTGRTFAADIAGQLHGIAEKLKVLDLAKCWSEIPNHGDISDMVAALGADTALDKLDTLTNQTAEFTPEDLPESIPDFYDGKRFLHHVMGDYLMAKFQVCKINEALHIYDDGVYRRGEDVLHGYMVKLAPELKDNQRKEVYKYMRVNLNTPVKESSPPHLIPFRTKIYDLLTDCFLDYSPEHVFLNRFPYDYKPDAPAQSIITDTINQIADTNEEVVKLLYEAIGNCFYFLNSYRGATFLYGESGNNGKSTLLNMISQLLGNDNISNLSVQDTAERFRLVKIYGKVANIGDDIPDSYIPDSSTFKKLVTGEAITAENKGQEPFTFRSFGKLFFAMNGLPPVSDKSNAFYGRLLLIPLTHDFAASGTQDVSLKNRAWTQAEMEYLTVLAVNGLKRLIAQGDFTRPAIVTEALREYERSQNPVIEYLEECPVESGEAIRDVYAHFRNWAECSGHKNIYTRYKFTHAVCEKTGMKSASIRHRNYPNQTVRCFVAD